MKIYNTMSRKKEELKTITPGEVKIYACGPTVYNYIHIGNARPMIVFDTLRRYLEYLGNKVLYVSNITDIDDKLIKKGQEDGTTMQEVARKFEAEYIKDSEGLNVKAPTVRPRATEHIGEIIKIVKDLVESGHAYVARNGDVYFRVKSDPGYGKLSHLNLDDLESGNRELRSQMDDDLKEDPADFAVWKAAKPGEPSWNSPWGQGRPGWHIECSAMARKHLGKTIDLHCGGQDLIFPHHENEIAQSESYLGHPWCPHWCHVAHLNTDHGKMSKSKGEFLTVSLLEEKGYDPLAYRFFCLQSHYRKSLVFTWENLDNATVAYNKLLSKIAALNDEGEVDWAAFDEYKAKFMAAMDNDLNTSMAVTVLYDVLKAKTNDKTKLALLDSFDTVLGLKLLEKAAALRAKQAAASTAGEFAVISEDGETNAEEETLIRARADAKKAKNFAEADRIRDELKAQGIEITDVPGGAKWKRV